MKPFRRKGGDVVARLADAEAGIVGLLLDQLEQLLTADPDDAGGDPVVERLLPPGHASDPDLAAEYRDLTAAALREGKADDLALVRATLPAQGGEVRLDATVSEITVVDGQVTGVVLADGERIESAVVIAAIAPDLALNSLVTPGAVSAERCGITPFRRSSIPSSSSPASATERVSVPATTRPPMMKAIVLPEERAGGGL